MSYAGARLEAATGSGNLARMQNLGLLGRLRAPGHARDQRDQRPSCERTPIAE